MRPSLSQRISFTDRSIETRADRGLMARSLMYLLAVGGVIPLAALASASPAHLPVAATAAAFTWGGAALLLGGYDALPGLTLQLLVAGAAALVNWTVAESGAPGYAPLLLPLAIYAVYFFSKPAAGLQLAAIVAGYATAAASRHVPLETALVSAASLAATVTVVGSHRVSANRLIWGLKDVARTDPLTGLLNRRGFEELLETELERSRRSGRPLSLIVGDLDHFKLLNDRFGHAAGDRALERLSLILETAKRRIDTAARIGGEELAVILPDSDEHAAHILAERMRREIRDTFSGEPHELTISLGVATFPHHATTAETLIACADHSLYAAKALGRDRTAVYSDELEGSVFDAASGDGSAQSRTVLALAEALDRRESSRDAHSQTVGRYAAAIARALGLPEELIERVRFGGIVHDIGKIGLPESVLSKPSWLNANDWFELRRHPEIGAEILSSVELHDVSEWVRAHHERPDGTGYPAGLAGVAIPLEARILAVADAYEAMTSDRVYRAALTPEEARAELIRGSGTQFDRCVVEAFVCVLDGTGVSRRMRLVR